ncbi:ABC transporter substrate binding protein [Achromobacter aloeverae]|uniref:ABC transporter substrate-binding protein n=1 Tax=Achromobacter aloeverae TaxID=1750518 RepID=A0A4Q1HQC5_9BURK|nr:ABC transporter substrate binding protein [Achromobacter aloeverae]RXN93057.1 ABC transporter substrate-binding protein [Achromobacter aloeverae]
MVYASRPAGVAARAAFSVPFSVLWARVARAVRIAASSLLVPAVALAAPSAWAAGPAPKSVAVMTITDHPALDAVRDGVRDALKAAGYDPARNLKWQFQSAQGNNATAAQIARKFVGDRPDVIVAISTPAAQAVAAATKDVPLVYAAVTDPVAAQLVAAGPQAADSNVTGVSDALPLDRQIELIKKIVPTAKRVGMVYNPGEPNSVVVVKQMQDLLPKSGMSLIEAAAPRTVDVGSAARSLIGKADVIYASTDNNVVSAFEALTKVSNDARIPLVASDTDSVKRGAVAALGVNYHDMGVQAGRIAVRILKGDKPGAIAPESAGKPVLFVNATAAQKQGVTLSDALLKSAAQVLR